MVSAVNNNNAILAKVPRDQEFAQHGQALFNAGNFAAAWVSFNEAIKINPNVWDHHYMRGASSSNLGNYKAALTDYNTALRLSKTNDEKGWTHFDLAILYSKMGDEQSALSHLKTAAKLGNGLAQNFCKEYGFPY